MKKYTALIPVLFSAFFLCGCENQIIAPSIPDMNKCYTAYIESETVSGEKLSAVLTRGGVNEWSLEISEPYALSGTALKISDGKITASFEGFSAEIPLEAGVYSAFTQMTDVFERLTDPEGLSLAADGTSLSVQGEDFTVFFENKAPVRLIMESSGAEVKMSDFIVTADIPKESDVMLVR